jgi:hypothetical protein
LQARTDTNRTERVLETARYLVREHQKWNIAPAGNGFSTILCAQNQEALTARDAALQVSAFTGTDSQLWKLDRLADGSYRVARKVGGLALTEAPKQPSGNGVTTEKFNDQATQHWIIVVP